MFDKFEKVLYNLKKQELSDAILKSKKKHNIHTDANFDNQNSVATYSIIIMSENKILKSYSKKSIIEIKNSTELKYLQYINQ